MEWSDKKRGTAGVCYCRKITRSTGAIERSARIELATKIVDSAERLRDTLVHEMCHAATWIVNEVADGHGKCWKAWYISHFNHVSINLHFFYMQGYKSNENVP